MNATPIASSGTREAVAAAVRANIPANVVANIKWGRSHEQKPGTITVEITEHDTEPLQTGGFIRGYVSTYLKWIKG